MPATFDAQKNKIFKEILITWFRNDPAAQDEIIKTEKALKKEGIIRAGLPNDYTSFLLLTNGGEGWVGSRYVSLWRIEEVQALNKSYQIDHYLPGIVGVGTDGGGQCYALDFRYSSINPTLVQVPLGDLGIVSLVLIGESFGDGLRELLKT